MTGAHHHPAPRRPHSTITVLAQVGVPRGITALVVGHGAPAFTECVSTRIDTETARH